jgi:hypothetical protein
VLVSSWPSSSYTSSSAQGLAEAADHTSLKLAIHLTWIDTVPQFGREMSGLTVQVGST